MERDNFTCVLCGDTESTLNVHHTEYIGNPWDAKDETLKTVCHECHRIIHMVDDAEVTMIVKEYYNGCKCCTIFSPKHLIVFAYVFGTEIIVVWTK